VEIQTLSGGKLERGGKVTGESSTNSLVNLITARVIDQDYANVLAEVETNVVSNESTE